MDSFQFLGLVMCLQIICKQPCLYFDVQSGIVFILSRNYTPLLLFSYASFIFARCCCGRLIGEHTWQDSLPPLSLCPGPGQDVEEEWSMKRHTRASPTNAYGTVDFEDTATRVCRAKVCKFECFLGKRKKIYLS